MTGHRASPSQGSRPPLLAIVANSLPPYQAHLYERLVRELDGVDVLAVLTHDVSSSPWPLPAATPFEMARFGAGESVAGQSRLHRQPLELWKGLRIALALRRRRAGAVIVNAYNDAGRLFLIAAAVLAGRPVFVALDSNAASDRARGAKALAKRCLITALDATVSGFMVCGLRGQEFLRRYGARRAPTYLVPYEPDYRQIEALAGDGARAAAASRLGLDPARRRIVYSGRLAPEKRVDLLLLAFARIAEERADWDLVVVGDGPLAGELRALLPPALGARVRWLGFQADPRVVFSVYHCADVLALPSDYEPWALVVCEAVAAGLAVVASDAVGAAVEIVRDGVNGRVFRRGELTELTDCLRDVTAPARIDALKRASAGILAEWRRRADPVAGVRAALRDVGVAAGGGDGAAPR